MRNNEYALARQVLTLANQILKSRNGHLKELHLTAEQADSLTFFYFHTDTSISDLKDHLHIRHQTARGIVKRLEEKGLLTLSVAASDGRCKTVSLTEKGIQIVERLKQNGTHTGYRLLSGMTETEQEQFSALIAKALNNME
jgi:DNA-binding MarR family transcriptional regulator